ncbi:2-oxo-4-hydroxy-4-carboxy-5-ureidoimidazoline decarboxylase [Xanthobacter oligotrophicus]|uniref:2-oxo-4-hydroxy-4-carboxy-5-ureidoimidazoline decarboxylase n=1 Tax=Xanthobacter oligotrophicus TaxID=2607286 RepID=A0ABW6ZUB3_9HYPH
MPSDLIRLDALNAMSAADFAASLGPVFENAPWVAQQAAAARPFASLTDLHKAMLDAIGALPPEALLGFLRGHPRLSAETLRRGTTAESTVEQTALGLDALDADLSAQLERLNAAYEARFGYPFILAVRKASLATLFATFERRLAASPEAERAEALAEISAISWMRLLDRVRAAPTGSVSTHVLDTVRAAPAGGLGVELWRREGDGAMTRILAFVTNDDGACDGALLDGGALCAGTYEWRYDTPTYFARHGYSTPARAYLGKVRVAFTVWNPEEHFHVPLLLSPGAYTTYRGS